MIPLPLGLCGNYRQPPVESGNGRSVSRNGLGVTRIPIVGVPPARSILRAESVRMARPFPLMNEQTTGTNQKAQKAAHSKHQERRPRRQQHHLEKAEHPYPF